MEQLITNKEDLIEYLTTNAFINKPPPESVYVTSNLRKDIMTDRMQGKFIYKGCIRSFAFKNLGGGVYEASISKEPT